MLNALTVDVEDYFHVHAFSGVIDRKDWDKYPCRVERNTDRLLDLFAQANVRGTFFVLGWVAQRFPKLIQRIHSAGHYIGCHGYAHQVIYSEGVAAFRKDVKLAKECIEQALGASVRSYRAPSFSITKNTLWALEVLIEEGFEFDSSIFPIVHDNYGIPEAPRFPYIRYVNGNAQINEFPPSTVPIAGVNVPVAGGGYLRLYPYAVTAWALRRINNVEQQPGMIYLHPWELDPEQPRVSVPWRSRFRHYQNLESTERKCRKLLEDFAWAPLEAVFGDAVARPSANQGAFEWR